VTSAFEVVGCGGGGGGGSVVEDVEVVVVLVVEMIVEVGVVDDVEPLPSVPGG
jgi:hypothetical protein